MHTIIAAVSKLQACIAQVELLNPSGASEYDIMIRAKEIMKIDPKYTKGFKFNHVWDIVKDLVKFECMQLKSRVERYSSEPGTSVSDSPMSPDGLSSVNINSSSDDSGSGSASKRPIGVKKSKMKKKGGKTCLLL